MKTIDEIKKDIEKLQAELNNAVNEFNFCQQKARDLAPKINYLSGKIDALNELMKEPLQKKEETDP